LQDQKDRHKNNKRLELYKNTRTFSEVLRLYNIDNYFKKGG